MFIDLHGVPLRLTICICTVAVAQLACTLVSGKTPTLAPAIEPTQETPATQRPAPIPTGVPAGPAAATVEAPSLPDRPLSESGPWYAFMAFGAEHELWALNADGSGLTMLWSYLDEDEAPYDESFTLWPAPSGRRVAILQFDRSLQTAPLLRLLELPSGNMQTIANLLPRQVDYESLDGDSRSTADQVWAAVGALNNIAWSPDGRLMAFNAAIDGPSADVYVYDTSTDKIERLTDGPDQSVDLAWSPDNGYIVHGVARSLYYNYSGLGYDMLGAWAVPPDPASSAIGLYDHAFHGYEEILGWLDDGRYLTDSLDGDSLGNCGYFNLRTVDILDGEGPVPLTGNYTERAFDPETRMMVMVVSSVLKEFDCNTSLDPGVYLFDVDSQKARLVPEVDPEPIQSATWNEEAGLFFLGGGSELVTVDPTGSVGRFPSPEDLWDSRPVVGPGGSIWALTSGSLPQRLDVGTRAGDLIEIDVQDAYDPFWSLDEEWLFFFDALNLYAAPAPDFEPAIIVGKMLSPSAPVLVNP
jgi:hypothetical protein